MTNSQTICLWGLGKIGLGIARHFSEMGNDLLIIDIDSKNFDNLPKNLHKNSNIVFKKIDIENVNVTDLIETYKSCKNEISGFINCTYPSRRDKKIDIEDIDERHSGFSLSVGLHFDNYHKFLLSSSEYLIRKKIKGSVVSISSMYGSVLPDFELYSDNRHFTPPDYVAAKAGLNSLSKYFAKKMKKNEIRFNTISPGGIFADQEKNFVRRYVEKSISNKMLEPQDLAKLSLFLLSDESKMFTGQDYIIDGGFTL